MSQNFSCHSYQEKDLEEILNLFSLCFGGRTLPADYYLWRVLQHPLQKNFIDVFKNENNKLISHYAVCPALSFYQGSYFNSALSLITMTHPDYNGMGLFPKLADHLYNRIYKEDDVQLVYGFPNTNSHYSFTNKLGWNDVYMIPTLRKQIKADANAKTEFKNEEIIDARFDNLWEQASGNSNSFFANARTASYLKWRFKDCPNKKYDVLCLHINNQIIAYAVVKEYVNNSVRELDIIDFLFANEVMPADVVNNLVAYAQLNKFEAINLWTPYNSAMYAACEKSGFLPKEPITYIGYKPFNPENKLAELIQPKIWQITMCDSDVY